MPNKAVNADAFFVRYAHYKCAGYGWRYALLRFIATDQENENGRLPM